MIFRIDRDPSDLPIIHCRSQVNHEQEVQRLLRPPDGHKLVFEDVDDHNFILRVVPNGVEVDTTGNSLRTHLEGLSRNELQTYAATRNVEYGRADSKSVLVTKILEATCRDSETQPSTKP